LTLLHSLEWIVSSKARKRWTDFVAPSSIQPALFDSETLRSAQPKRRRPGTIKPPRPLEKDIKTAIFNALSAHPLVLDVCVVGVSSGQMVRPDGSRTAWRRWGEAGTPDIVGRLKGCPPRRFRIEVKTPLRRNTVTPEQRDRLDETIAAGGLAGVACSVKEALAIVEGRS
jgi:hypothetical protein